ncbi:hypothetical protein PHYBLDRAFT_67538 [Phycomyces blakesleeanus NRRL 1555(-)]|uniref:Uncharacterized protein n=1 Tax=Phycomyces blakesleeanus (strain ATCC 8743b / DSM 1359 / FGSC 10004 / NBRC 33097 / NRRL 1555) TaxID=763407 RepID=A0A162U9D4_PHYB8|nr:hypothetical protein PHYBLDRAFT_67538 [Phycomyces blakesleeanus NRRL 1555(-)]OAD74542.1 hypothetical protein PHYBLDRAFT_67538 [Phycomyces blakesleeanus NRRL 1555(-)]|eukprot:XP_018292582.1 hypothetical protein PHYBLDRAFT_67538 [Phycomyces blakesleeanus NRRL 1555(-)]
MISLGKILHFLLKNKFLRRVVKALMALIILSVEKKSLVIRSYQIQYLLLILIVFLTGRLNDICPDLFRLKEIMQTRMTKSLCVSNSDKPVSFAREYGMSSATRKEISVKDKKQDNGDEIAILEPVSKDEHHLLDALDFIAPLIVGTAGKNPSLALNTSGDDSLLALGPTSNLLTSSLVPEMTKSKKRDSTHAQLVKEREKAVDKKLKVMDAAAKAFQDKKIAIKEAYFLKVREDHWKKETLDADMNMILGMASLFYWSEKKIREEYA